MAEAWSQRRRGFDCTLTTGRDTWRKIYSIWLAEKSVVSLILHTRKIKQSRNYVALCKKSRKRIFILDDRCLNRKHNDICKAWMNHFCMWLAHFAFCVSRKSYLKFIFHVFHLWVITWFFSCNFDKISTRIFFSNALNRTFPFDSRCFVILWKTLLCFFTQNHVITCTKTTKKYRVECEKGNKHGCHSTSVKLIITLLHFNLFILI